MKTPVLLLFFNRKDILKLTLEAIRFYRPTIIYLASDGPRFSVSGEYENIQDIRNYVLESIDWPCEVKTLFSKENLGCKNAVHKAIQWFFSQEDNGIVIEDDIVPTINFFEFCAEALDTFKEDKRIGSITGRNDLQKWGRNDCFAASRFQCWGWASWADRILGFDVEYGYFPRMDYSCLYDDCLWEERFYLDSVLGLLQTKQVNSWAYPYDLNFKKNKQLQIYPRKNMVKNSGFGPNGTHSSYNGVDGVHVYNNFKPYVYSDLLIIDDKNYIKQKLRGEYGGILQLLFMRHIRYFGWLRKLKKFVYKKMMK
jgi:hypothetical protein